MRSPIRAAIRVLINTKRRRLGPDGRLAVSQALVALHDYQRRAR